MISSLMWRSNRQVRWSNFCAVSARSQCTIKSDHSIFTPCSIALVPMTTSYSDTLVGLSRKFCRMKSASSVSPSIKWTFKYTSVGPDLAQYSRNFFSNERKRRPPSVCSTKIVAPHRLEASLAELYDMDMYSMSGSYRGLPNPSEAQISC